MFQSLMQTIHDEGSSVRAYELCAIAARGRILEEPQNAAALFLIATAAQRFVDVYEGEPLQVDAANRELARIRGYVDQLSEAYSDGAADRKLSALNDVAADMASLRA